VMRKRIAFGQRLVAGSRMHLNRSHGDFQCLRWSLDLGCTDFEILCPGSPSNDH
jgi:hypothetical protein